ncbi:intein/intein [Alteromonadaceae bacterium 2753L.S.0a.02]|nr:intein/intein [Alteromonadaceae bacterium 2753L.S.0a.02]
MDTWSGNSQDPITLHKYLYANADPGNMVDPSGNFSIGSMMSTINTMATLVSRAQAAISLFNIATGEEELSAKELGAQILFNMVGGKFMRLFAKGCNSFDGDTLVATSVGLVPIRDIRIGDLVWAYDEESGQKSLQEVIHLIVGEGEKSLVDITLLDGEVIRATAEHPFFDPVFTEWFYAADLSGGATLLNLDGNHVSVDSVSPLEASVKVFNLTVNNDHTFYVGEAGVLSHNANNRRCAFLKDAAKHRNIERALSNYPGRTVKIGNSNWRISKENMEHFLTRHHPRMWDGSTATRQTFFDKDMSILDVENAVLAVMKQNGSKLMALGVRAPSGTVMGIYKGKRYQLGIRHGQVGLFFPLD